LTEIKFSFSNEKYGRFKCSRNRTVPNRSRKCRNPSVQHRNTPGPGRPLHLFLTDRSGYHDKMQSLSEVPVSDRSRSLLSYEV
jgi:hypothetical protein